MDSSSGSPPVAGCELDAALARQYASLQFSLAFDLLAIFRHLTVSTALNHLDGLRFRLNIFHLYQHFFPDEYACSLASPQFDATGSGHSDREVEFFQLVLSRLFPILDPDLLDDEIRFEGIPIEVCGLTYDDADQLDVGYQILAAAIGALGLEWRTVADEWPVELPAPAARLPGKVLDLNRFDRLCRKRGAAWRNLAVLARLVCNETGNDFLDLTDEVPLEWPPWTQENLEYLHHEWTAADRLLSQAQTAAQWLKDSPRRMAAVIPLLDQATVAIKSCTQSG